MLRSLHIRDYAIIEALEVEFDGGLNIITGETGAGKSILIGALQMILGERASTDTVRRGAKKAVIEGIFEEVDSPVVRDLLEENGIEMQPHIILRREIHSTMSRAFINDTPATVSLLRQVADQLIDLHGQHEHQSLLRVETHGPLLDTFGRLEGVRAEYERHYERVHSLIDERDDLRRRKEELAREKELYGFQIDEIDRINPQPDEEEELLRRRRVLENAEELHAASAELTRMLYDGEGALHDQVGAAVSELRGLVRIDDDLEELLKEMESAQIIVSEVAHTLQDYHTAVECDPEQLEEIRERLSALESLKRKYGGSVEAVLDYRREIGASHQEATNFQERLETLDTEIAEAQSALSESADRLFRKRREKADELKRAIIDELAALEMPHSQFEVRLTRQEHPEGWIISTDNEQSGEEGSDPKRFKAFTTGAERVAFFISTNVGEVPRSLQRVASGGEVSRIMLALKTILAKNDQMPILVFDEIDVGISGATARKVGEKMHGLAKHHQIIAITHLPQIAALGNVHYAVEKIVEQGRTKTTISRLEKGDRTAELAALISGDDVSDAAIENARELMRKDG